MNTRAILLLIDIARRGVAAASSRRSKLGGASGRTYSARGVETPLRHWRCSRCFSPRTLCFERAARGHSRRGGRPPGSDWSTFFDFDAGELWRVRANSNKPATLAIFCSHFDPFVCVRTVAILPEHTDPFLFCGCRRD